MKRKRERGELPAEDGKHFRVRPYKAVYGIGIFIIAVGVLVAALEASFHAAAVPWWIYLLTAAIFLAGIHVFAEAKNRGLTVEESRLCYRNTRGKVRSFEVQDIGYARASGSSSGGQDYLRLYDKEGKLLCRLDYSMHNTDYLVSYLYDNKIPIEMAEKKERLLAELEAQHPVSREELPELSQRIFEEATVLVRSWKEKNKKLGADFYYGYAQYYGKRIKKEVQTQSPESRYEADGGELPEDYLCVMEIYVKKDNCFVLDKRGNFLVMDFPVFYQRGTGKAGETYRLYYNSSCRKEMEDAFRMLGSYLTGHRFRQERLEPGCELKERVGTVE